MKINKFFYGAMVIIVLIIFSYHYKLNYHVAIQPPSEKWAKEVLIAEGNIKGFPSITKYKNNYIAAFSEGKDIKVMSVDPLGKVLQENLVSADTEVPQNISIFQSGDKLILSYLVIGAESGELRIITLDENLKASDNNLIQGLVSYIKIDDNTLAAVYKEKIDLINLKENKVTSVKTGEDTFLASAVKYNGKDCILYTNSSGEFSYFFLDNGVPSDIKTGGAMSPSTRVRFSNMTSVVNNGIVTNLIEYMFKSDYIGYKYVCFSLDTGEVTGNGEFHIKAEFTEKGYTYNGAGITIATPTVYTGKEGTLLLSSTRDMAKGKNQTDIMEMQVQEKLGANSEVVSRTKAVSINPAIHEDTLVFLDIVKEGEAKIYMTSTREDFKEANNKSRFDEKVEAFIETGEALVFSLAYVITYGMIWIIPSISLFSLLSLIEYRFSYKVRKIIFISTYVVTSIVKILAVKITFFKNLQGALPANFTFPVGAAAMIIISLICLVYGYLNYKDDLEKNVMALSYTKPIFIDSFLTLALFVGFIK